MTTDQLTEVSYSDFIVRIAADHNISPEKEHSLRLPVDKKTVKRFTQSEAHRVRIFDGENEHPYMLESGRNELAFINGVELRVKRRKPLAEIISETGVKLKRNKIQISEGGGWYSKGIQYTYKNIYCEV